MLLTRIHFPSPLHIIVYLMAAAILVVAFIKIEWAIIALALMLPFARPGFTLGPERAFHVSGFNVALVGVWALYTVRYLTDKSLAGKGPFVRRTPLDMIVFFYLILVAFSSLSALNLNPDLYAQSRVLVYWKEQLLYFAWFYLLVTLLKKPEDVRSFAVAFALSGLVVAAIGLFDRLSAGGATGVTEWEERMGIHGVRVAGAGEGWFGLVHANYLGMFMLACVPIWLFGVVHLKRLAHRTFAEAAAVVGFMGLLFTYSRSAWVGFMAGLGLLGLVDRKVIVRIVVFFLIFAVAAQALSLAYAGVSVWTLVSSRFEQLQRTGFSYRPAIIASDLDLMKAHPILGVGLGAFRWHVRPPWEGADLRHAHNLVLAIACEMGIPAAVVFILLAMRLFFMVVANLRRLRGTPGYAFLAQGAFAAFIGITGQSVVVHLFHHLNPGYALFSLFAIIVVLNRMIVTGQLPPPAAGAEVAGERAKPPSRIWIGS